LETCLTVWDNTLTRIETGARLSYSLIQSFSPCSNYRKEHSLEERKVKPHLQVTIPYTNTAKGQSEQYVFVKDKLHNLHASIYFLQSPNPSLFLLPNTHHAPSPRSISPLPSSSQRKKSHSRNEKKGDCRKGEATNYKFQKRNPPIPIPHTPQLQLPNIQATHTDL
jgi:hypothetical protein